MVLGEGCSNPRPAHSPTLSLESPLDFPPAPSSRAGHPGERGAWFGLFGQVSRVRSVLATAPECADGSWLLPKSDTAAARRGRGP